MPDNRTSIRRRARTLLASLMLAALAALCAWGAWAAAQPDLGTFVLPGARDVRQERLGPGMDSLTYSYDGSVIAQSIRLHTAVARRGWQVSQSLKLEDCEGQCVLGAVTLIFTRDSFFNRINEVVTIDQRGIGPYRVRVVLRRCIRLPSVGCWPPG